MEVLKVKIGTVKSNPNNPRVIKDDKLKKLVQSIKEFPKMLEIRPIVVNDDMVVLGGNMRLPCLENHVISKLIGMGMHANATAWNSIQNTTK